MRLVKSAARYVRSQPSYQSLRTGYVSSSPFRNPSSFPVSCSGGACRWYRLSSTSSTPWNIILSGRHHNRVAGILELRDRQPLVPQEFVKRLPRLSQHHLVAFDGLIFLATPRLAHLFAEGSDFVKLALQQIYGEVASTGADAKDFCGTAYIGIADKLPGRWQIDGQKVGPIEGLAMMLVQGHRVNSQAAGDLDQLSTFQMNINAGASSSKEDSVKESITVSLANTLFVNGKHSTLFKVDWKLSDLTSRARFLQQGGSKQQHLQHVELMADPGERSVVTSELPLQLPLIPLTPVRVVREIMGNVIREIEVDSKVTPASQELEDAVMQVVKQRKTEGKANQKTQVFALLKPGNVQETQVSSHGIIAALRSGARLHKVTGGGGGWGQKRGLLSLDPEFRFYETHALSKNLESDTAFGGFGQQSRISAQIANPGDTIQFFLYVDPAEHDYSMDARLNSADLTIWSESAPKYQRQDLIGTIPAQDEPVPVISSEADHHSSSPVPHIYKNMFGVLSERGLVYQRHLSSRLSPGEHDSKTYVTGAVETFSSKIDVPNSYVFAGVLQSDETDAAGKTVDNK